MQNPSNIRRALNSTYSYSIFTGNWIVFWTFRQNFIQNVKTFYYILLNIIHDFRIKMEIVIELNFQG